MEFTFAISAMFTLYSKFALHYLTYLTTFVFLLIFSNIDSHFIRKYKITVSRTEKFWNGL